MQDATAFAALLMRFSIVTFCFGLIYALVTKGKWLTPAQMGHSAVTGMLLHGFYLGGVFFALSQGLSATIAALIASLQPIVIALLAGPLLAERITKLQWCGIALGFAGAIIVIGFDIGNTVPPLALLICFAALGSSIAGTLYQKKFGQDLPLIPANICQAFAASLLHLTLLLLFEAPVITFTTNFITGITWQILAVSFGAYVMWLVLLQRGTAHQTSSLLFLIAPVAAVQSWFVLSETITSADLLGLALASIGVFFATRQSGPAHQN